MAGAGWYSRFDTSKPLEQGLVLRNFTYVDPTSLDKDVFEGAKNPKLLERNVIILTQSCDLVSSKSSHVHICPIVSLSSLLDEKFKNQSQVTSKEKNAIFDELSKGQWLQYHLTDVYNLGSLKDLDEDYQIIVLSQAAIVSSAYIKEFAMRKKTRPILKPPYREALAQSYARYFMRVGNPINITKFKQADYLQSKRAS